MAGVNYYPAATPWHRFWPEFDLTIIRKDLALIHGLGANSVRIFLQRGDVLDPDLAPTNLENLRQFLNAAQDQGLQVVPMLFDLRAGYDPSLWAGDYRLLQHVLPVLARAPNVAFVDLKNEADLDFGLYGKAIVQAWLKAMAVSAHAIAPDLSLTVGWSSAEAATEMTDLVDGVTFHDFLTIDQTGDRLATVRAQELTGHGLALQAADGVLVWTLDDFSKPDQAVVGRWPWHKSLQKHYGLFDDAGQGKPAAAAVRSLFTAVLKE